MDLKKKSKIIEFCKSKVTFVNDTNWDKGDKNRKIAWSKVNEVRVQVETPNIVTSVKELVKFSIHFV
jgi:hypothetical protein